MSPPWLCAQSVPGARQSIRIFGFGCLCRYRGVSVAESVFMLLDPAARPACSLLQALLSRHTPSLNCASPTTTAMRAHATALGLLAVYIDPTPAFLLPIAGIRSRTHQQVRAHDIAVTLPAGEIRTVPVQEGQSILDALEADDIDAPHSCRSGLCTE